MGVVLRAYDPRLRREVALKKLRRKVMGAEAEARLEREAQTMAQLNHPNVVGVFDVHASDDGLFVAMEYVAGTSLRQWLRSSRDERQILELFQQAGRGLAAAHRAGIVHRDFKPANVLVFEGEGGKATVKVTDFGLARPSTVSESDAGVEGVSGSVNSEDSTLTRPSAVLGTPRYMAPEQHLGEPTDARTDQFGFCVGLWEALHDEPPFVGTMRELEKAKLSGPPKWPGSGRVASYLEAPLLRGLSPNPNDRWPDMEALLQALRPEPVRRRRTKVAGAALLAGLGAVAAGVYLEDVSKREACERAGAVVAEAWNPAAATQVEQAFEAAGVPYAADSLARLKPTLDGYAEQWRSARIEACMSTPESTPERDRRVACLDERRRGLKSFVERLVAADSEAVRRSVSAATAMPRVDRCGDRAWLASQPSPPAGVDADRIADIRGVQQRVRLAMRLAAFEDAATLAKRAFGAAETLGWEPLMAETRLLQGRADAQLAKYDEAESAFRASYLMASRAGHDRLGAEAASSMAFLVGFNLARHDEARLWTRLSDVALDRAGVTDGGALAEHLLNAAATAHAAGRFDDALDRAGRALEVRRRSSGDGHLDVAMALETAAGTLYALGRYDEARENHEQALKIRVAQLGGSHPAVGQSQMNLGNVAAAQNQTDVARTHYDAALELRRKALGPDDPRVAEVLNNLAVLESDVGNLEAAEARYRESLRVLEATFGRKHTHVAKVLNNLAALSDQRGRPNEAIEEYERALAIRTELLGPRHLETAATEYNLALVYGQTGELERASSLALKALSSIEAAVGPKHPYVALVESLLGRFDLDRGNVESARTRFERALGVVTAAKGEQDPDAAEALVGLGLVDAAEGDRASARERMERALRLVSKGAVDPASRGAVEFALAKLLWEDGEHERSTTLADAAQRHLVGPAKEDVVAWLAAVQSP